MYKDGNELIFHLLVTKNMFDMLFRIAINRLLLIAEYPSKIFEVKVVKTKFRVAKYD